MCSLKGVVVKRAWAVDPLVKAAPCSALLPARLQGLEEGLAHKEVCPFPLDSNQHKQLANSCLIPTEEVAGRQRKF